MTERTSTSEITRALVLYHRSKSRPPIVWEEIEASTSVGRCRFDVLTADVLAGHRLRLRAYEVKVTTQDFWRDVEAEKSMKYLDAGASCVHYVVPKGLVTKKDVPEWAGLITWNPDTGAFRHTKKAPVELRPIPEDFMVRMILRKDEEAKRSNSRTRSERIASYRQDLRGGYWVNYATQVKIRNAERLEADVRRRRTQADEMAIEAQSIMRKAKESTRAAQAVGDFLKHASWLLDPTHKRHEGPEELVAQLAEIVPQNYGQDWRS